MRSNCDNATLVLSLNELGFPSKECSFHSNDHVLSHKQQHTIYQNDSRLLFKRFQHLKKLVDTGSILHFSINYSIW